MADDISLQLILSELKGCRRQIDGLVKDVANLKAVEGEHSKHVQRFWAENWGPLKSDIQDIKNRLAALEQGDVVELERRLDKVESDTRVITEVEVGKRLTKLETTDARKYGAASAAGVVGGGIMSYLFKLFFEGVS